MNANIQRGHLPGSGRPRISRFTRVRLRNEVIRDAVTSGEKHIVVAQKHGVSRQRVSQIVHAPLRKVERRLTQLLVAALN